MRYYHASSEPLALGVVLNPPFGTKGREPEAYKIMNSALAEGLLTVKSIMLTDALLAAYEKREENMSMVLKETILERIRASHYPDKPRRLGEAVFLCPTLEDALRFQKLVGDRPHLYLCEVTGGTQTELDMTFVARADFLVPIKQQVDELIERAHPYWRGDKGDDPIMELLATGTVTVVEAVSR